MLHNRTISCYLLTNLSKKMRLYFIHDEANSLGKFKKWHKLVERETWKKVKKLCKDQGEFTSSEFNYYCMVYGIKHQLIASHTLWKLSVIECCNHIVEEISRFMMKVKGLLDSFWEKVINVAIYILNRSYTKAFKGIRPYEAYFVKKPLLFIWEH